MTYAGSLCEKSMEIQSLILPKEKFTKRQAKAWLKRHGFKATLDEKINTYRARQYAPSRYRKGLFRTISLGDKLKAVVGCPK